MNPRHLYRSIILTLLTVITAGTASPKTLTVTPGTLGTLLGNEANTTIALTLKGAVNVTDLLTIARMEALVDLDMSGVTIESLYAEDPVYLSRRSFPANTIPDYVFFTSRFTKIVLPAGLTTIEEGAFAASAVKEVVFPAGLTTIGAWAFLNCPALTAAQLPATVTTLGKGTFKQCTALTEMNLSGTALTALPDEAFMGCSRLASVTFPAALESIGEFCFTSTALTQMVTGTRVTSIGAYSLSSIPTLKTADLGTTAMLGDGVLAFNDGLTTLTNVPGRLSPAALAACPQLVLDTTMTKTFTHIGDMALADNPTDRYLFSENLIYVGNSIWDGADNLRSINVFYLKGNIPQTADSAFYGIKDIDTRELWVNKDYATPWEQHPLWNQFYIHRATESVEQTLLPGEQAIEFYMDGTTLVITAQSPLTHVMVTDLSGLPVAAMRPDAPSARIDLSDRQGSVLIIKASTASASRTSKLTIRR